MGRLYRVKKLKITENIYKRIVRIPFFCGLKKFELKKIENTIYKFFKNKSLNN